MNADFPRILTLLRKEKGISQKQAACELGISQALLSHYEKGIRECGLDFLVKTANFYHVSCDYLLGRSPDRQGVTITVDELPDPGDTGKENSFRGSVLPTLNKKLIANSLNILFDVLQRCSNKALTSEVSSFLMLAVYRMFRVLHSINPKSPQGMFVVAPELSDGYAQAAMQVSVANASQLAQKQVAASQAKLPENERVELTTEALTTQYPMFASSLLNLIQNSENKLHFEEK